LEIADGRPAEIALIAVPNLSPLAMDCAARIPANIGAVAGTIEPMAIIAWPIGLSFKNP
jgi:hypothetical protein